MIASLKRVWMAVPAAVLALVVVVGAGSAQAESAYNTTLFGNAIEGADPVAYFSEGRHVEGSSDYTYDWNGATWRFASAANRQLFVDNPEKYAPQYGGYCAFAAARGALADIDPEAWNIVDGKLYLNKNKSIQSEWLKDVPGEIARADSNWPRIKPTAKN